MNEAYINRRLNLIRKVKAVMKKNVNLISAHFLYLMWIVYSMERNWHRRLYVLHCSKSDD